MMIRQAIALGLTGIVLCGGGNSAAQGVSGGGNSGAAPAYAIKPSDIVLPPDVPLGQYRRIFQPFENWILICDENLKAKHVVCNATQSIVDPAGQTLFSWSLTVAQGGQPFMLLRTPADINMTAGVELSFVGLKKPLQALIEGCNQTVCLARTPVGPAFSEQIAKGAVVTVNYQTKAGRPVTLKLPLKGLKEAVASIK